MLIESAIGRPVLPGSSEGLAKFFGTDLLKQQLGAMPPLPNQGQSIMTVEEIERRQQVKKANKKKTKSKNNKNNNKTKQKKQANKKRTQLTIIRNKMVIYVRPFIILAALTCGFD